MDKRFDNWSLSFTGLLGINIYKDFLVHVGNHVSDMFSTQKGLKQGQALSTQLFNFASDVLSAKVNNNGMDCNGMQHIRF
jgi:hypothetical protein